MRGLDRDGGSSTGTTLRFCVLFLCIIGAFVLFDLSALSNRIVHGPLAAFTAWLAAGALAPFGNARALRAALHFNGFEVEIVDACDGVLPTLIYVAAILAFPSRFGHKVWGILIGLPAVFLVNLFRVITLMFIGARWPTAFEQVHLYVWQACVIAFALAAWLVWAEISVRRRAS